MQFFPFSFLFYTCSCNNQESMVSIYITWFMCTVELSRHSALHFQIINLCINKGHNTVNSMYKKIQGKILTTFFDFLNFHRSTKQIHTDLLSPSFTKHAWMRFFFPIIGLFFSSILYQLTLCITFTNIWVSK